MSVLVINSSPRKKVCFNILNQITKKFDERKIEYEVINIWDKNISYCSACGYCEKTGKCHIDDDMRPLYNKFDNSIGTIVISPVYFDCVPAKLKTVVDRTQAFYASKYILKKPSIDREKNRLGMFICVGGSRPYDTQFLGPQIVMDFFFKSINTNLKRNLYINGTDTLNIEDENILNDKICSEVNKYIDMLSLDVK